jgi:hypothetical protein
MTMTDERGSTRATILDAVIHLNNEQPLKADLFRVPEASDQGLLCTNLRTMSGKRPIFVDHVASTFFFPYQFIRFIEIHPSEERRALLAAPEGTAGVDEPPEAEIEIDEEFLRRIREV